MCLWLKMLFSSVCQRLPCLLNASLGDVSKTVRSTWLPRQFYAVISFEIMESIQREGDTCCAYSGLEISMLFLYIFEQDMQSEWPVPDLEIILIQDVTK